jgi:hypothetical protein
MLAVTYSELLLRDTLKSKLTIVRLFTSVTNPYIIFLALCFEFFFNLTGKIEKILYTRFTNHFVALVCFIALIAALLVL